jgi:asparagine synthase (glutamine-hydrolysing)
MSDIFGEWHRDATPPTGLDQLMTTGAAGIQIAFEGRLDNRDELLHALRGHFDVSPASADGELAALMYALRRDAFLAELCGDFALALYDARDRRLLLARDAIGVRPLYYGVAPRHVVFASTIQAILRHPDTRARPNERVLAAWMLQRLHRADDDGATCFDGISSVPGSHVAIVDADRVQVAQYWEFDAHLQHAASSFDDCAAALRSHLATAVARRLRSANPVAISVSGGVDSSALLCLARRSASPALAFTYTTRDGSPADESAFLDELEPTYGPIVRVATPNVGSILEAARERVRCAEAPMLDLQGNRSAAFMSAVAQSGAQVLMTGHWGDQLMFDQAYLVDALRQFSLTTVRTHLDEYLRWFPDTQGGEFRQRLLSDVLDHAAPMWVRPAARRIRRAWRPPEWWQALYSRRFREAAAPEGFRRGPRHGTDATSLCRALYREARSKYHAFCLETNAKLSARHGLTMTFPFLDRDLVAFVLGVPGELLARNGVPKALLREAIRGAVPESIRLRRTKGDFTAGVTNAARQEFAEILALLTRESLVVQFGYVEVDTMIGALRVAERELERDDSCVAAWRLTDVVALELWLQEFFGSPQQWRT